MRCPQCQHENPAGARFCGECGAPLEARCPGCGAANPPGNKFCHGCGQRLGGPASTTLPPPSPESYTPRYLAEKILTSRGVLEGERKQVTVLFADLKGSMELLADRDPEEARAILDPVLERMMEAVHRYEGTVNQVMGDGIMALFGAPLAHEDHAVRACYAALQMQEAIRRYGDEVWRSQNVRIQIRVGLNSGEVVVRSIGSDLRMDYTAVGQTTHLAARMEQLATPGSILLAPNTLQLVEGYVQVRSLGSVQVKGLTEPVEVYELIGAGTARSRLQATAARGLTKFVGRDAELETLRRVLEQAGSGQGQIVALVGEPGVGKSRLVWEFTHSHRTQGWLILETRSVSYGRATAYLPLIDLLKAYCDIDPNDDARHVREKLTGKVLALDPALGPLLPALSSLLEVGVEDAAWQALDPPQRRQRTLDALKRLLLRESQEQPVVLVLEDLHWIDGETQALLDSLVESLPTARILLLVNYRPEYEHRWGSKSYYSQLRLDPLPPASAEALLQALLGDDPSLQALRSVLIERTEGNPFFLEESVRALVEAGVLAGERGSYRLVEPLETVEAPATVQAVLAARIDRLAPEDKRLLQSAAVIGKDVPHAVLQAIAEVPETELPQGLARLRAAEFLYETSLYPELEYTFKHALTHEVAYGSLLHERRRALHARIVQAIEMLYPDRLMEYAERVAHHAVRGEMWEEAVSYSRQAGAKAAARSAHREAVTYFEQALKALGYLPLNRATREQAFDLHIQLRTSLQPLGALEQMLDHMRQAESLAQALDDQRRLGWVTTILSAYFWQIGDNERAIVSGERALSLARATGDFHLQVAANNYQGRAYAVVGRYGPAMDCLRWIVTSLPDELANEHFGLPFLISVSSRAWLGLCLAEVGNFTEAIAWGHEALRMAEAADSPFSIVAAGWTLGQSYIRKGAFEQATGVLERTVRACQEREVPLLSPFVSSILGYSYALSGRTNEGLPLLQQGLERTETAGFRLQQALCIAYLSEAYLLAGRWEDAAALARRAHSLALNHGERGHEAWALRLLGEIAARPDPPEIDQAEARYRQALRLAEELGMRPLVAHCRLGLGTLYRKVGCAEQAQAELATAAALYRAMEMPFWLARAEAELAAPH